MTYNALLDMEYTQADFEELIGHDVSEFAWQAISDEIRGRVYSYVEELADNLAIDYQEGVFGE